MDEGLYLTPDQWNNIKRAMRKLDTITGSGAAVVTNKPDTLTIHVADGDDDAKPTTTPTKFLAKITAAAIDGANLRWVYKVRRIAKTAVGYGGWSFIGSELTGKAYNWIEDINGSSGALGNGVDADGLADAGFSLQAVPLDTPVVCTSYRVAGTMEYWFSYENAVDGACG